jgi:hypothetical protein
MDNAALHQPGNKSALRKKTRNKNLGKSEKWHYFPGLRASVCSLMVFLQ